MTSIFSKLKFNSDVLEVLDLVLGFAIPRPRIKPNPNAFYCRIGPNVNVVCKNASLYFPQFKSRAAQSCYSVIGDKPFLWSKPKFDLP